MKTTEKEWITKAGLAAVIVHYECMDYCYYCGYVGIPTSHPYAKLKLYEQKIDELNVHGGITYMEMDSKYPTPSQNTVWLGFDTAHFDDHYMIKDLAFCIYECERLAEQLARIV